jgi:rubrerythrin
MHALPRHPSEIKARRVGDNPQAAIRLAIRGEQDSEKFYRQCAERCQKGAARQMFEKLADREHQHEIALREELGEVRGDFAWRSLEGAAPVEEDFWA